MSRSPEYPAGGMPPELRDNRRTYVSAQERGQLVGQDEPDDRRTSEGRQRILRERRRGRHPQGGGRGWGWISVLAAGAGLLVLVLWLLRTQVPGTFPPPAERDGAGRRLIVRAASLTFAAPDGSSLVVETQLLPDESTVEERMRGVIGALLAGPSTGLISPWPDGIALLDLFLSEDGTAYVNLTGSVRARLAPGDYTEWLLLASLTCTLCDNFPDVRGVRLLIDGESQGLLRRLMPLDRVYVPGMFTEAR